MPAKRKSRAELLLSGTLKNEPGRYGHRQDIAVRPLGSEPQHLTPGQRRIWREVVRSVPEGTLASSDRMIVEVVVRMVQRLRAGELHKAAEVNTLLTALSRLGMTPLDRSKITTIPTASPDHLEDPWEKLLASG